jgi:hypothetical protein
VWALGTRLPFEAVIGDFVYELVVTEAVATNGAEIR